MKIRTLAFAAAIAVTATGYAFAQGSATPMERDGSKAQDTSTSGTTKGTMDKDKMMKSSTTGTDTMSKSDTPMSIDKVSPASPNSGAK